MENIPPPPVPPLARRIRKRLGRLKCVLIDQWPYLPLVYAGRIRREKNRPALRDLPRIAKAPGPVCEIHMLCGHRDADMGMAASWSLLRFLPSADLYIHSDGSLDGQDMAGWAAMAESVTFTTKAERDRRAATLAATHPVLSEWRNAHVYGSKFLDVHLYGRAERIVLLDSDVLCFREPRELLEALSHPAPSLRWNPDCTTSYSASPERLHEILELTVPCKVNTGFMLTKRWDDRDLAYFDRVLRSLLGNGVPIRDKWAEQMLYAISSARHPVSGGFSSDYSVTLGGTPADAVMRHYVGVPRVRPRFHTEGVPRLFAQLRQSGVRAELSAIG